MSDIKHNNLATFVGVTTELPDIYEVWEYCAKGSLQDIIWNESIKLDNMFKFSIAIDILTGLKYLHESPIKLHGRLKSSNVVVDGRWTCKITDHGLVQFRAGKEKDEEEDRHRYISSLLWTAPELLRLPRKTSLVKSMKKGANQASMTQEGDVYACAVILKEIFSRNAPYSEFEDLTDSEIITRVRDGFDGEPFRPMLPELHNEKGKDISGILTVLESGWTEKPTDRLTARQMLQDVKKISPFKSSTVMDNMLRMMERYSNNLEELVGERTQQVDEEKRKSEALLYRMLPRAVAEKLKIGQSVEAESFDAVTIYFSDIVKFTNLSAESTPMQVVELLNGLYTLFDSTSARHDVYKVETIGDAYMLVSGLPSRNEDRHAVEIANCAMELLSGIMNFTVKHKPGYRIQLRIGLHTGPAVAGIVGLTMPRYCLFGSTVSQASSMESGGLPMRIHLSEQMFKVLSKFPGYHLALRGSVVELAGLGIIKSYWLYNRDGFNMPLPKFSEQILEDNPKPILLPISPIQPRDNIVSPRRELDAQDATMNTHLPELTRPKSRDGRAMANGTVPVSINDEVNERKKSRKNRKVNVLEEQDEKIDVPKNNLGDTEELKISIGKMAWQDNGFDEDDVVALVGSQERLVTSSPINRSGDVDQRKSKSKKNTTRKSLKYDVSSNGAYDNAAMTNDDEIPEKSVSEASPSHSRGRRSPHRKVAPLIQNGIDNKELLKIELQENHNSQEVPKTSARPEKVFLGNLGDQIVDAATLLRIRSTFEKPLQHNNGGLTLQQVEKLTNGTVEELE